MKTDHDKKGLKFCSGKGIHQEKTSPSVVFLSKLKLELKNVISTHTKAPAFLLGRKKKKVTATFPFQLNRLLSLLSK